MEDDCTSTTTKTALILCVLVFLLCLKGTLSMLESVWKLSLVDEQAF